MAALAAVTGCGGASDPTAEASGAATVTTVDPATTASAQPPGQPSSGTPVPVTAGKVDVRLSKTSYRIGEAVQATVGNGSDKPIHTEDFKTDCSIVTLQRLDSGTWKDIEGCVLGRPTATITIGTGLGQTVTINPNSVHLRDGGNRIGFAEGTYRVKFSHRLDHDTSGKEPLVVYSPEFTVR